MRLEFNQQLRMEQKLLQSPQMIQAMQILQLTTPELLDRIQEEIDENPFLEKEQAPEIDGPMLEGSRGDGIRKNQKDDENADAILSVPAPDRPSPQSLLSELRAADIEDNELALAKVILNDLDRKGFSTRPLGELATKEQVSLSDLQEALEDLRAISHPALGAVDLQEAFLLQLYALPEPHLITEKLVEFHFEELLANRLPQISRELGVTMDDLRGALDVLRTLDSRPLEMPQDLDMGAILPDILIELQDDDTYSVELVRDGSPEVCLSKSAREALDRAKTDKRLHDFLLKKLERARWFLDAVNHRRETLLRIAQVLVERQRDFLDYGPEKLQPLKMQEVADIVQVHLSTVSRAIRGKSAQTPQGILPLKAFFSGSQVTQRGGSKSRTSIQERVKGIVASEDKSAPLSDEEIVKILRQRDGVKVARRTIAKYRKALDIPPSTHRRAY